MAPSPSSSRSAAVELRHHRGDGEAREQEAEHEDPRRHLRRAEAVDGGALIEMRAMGAEDVLAVIGAAQQRDGGVGDGIERKQHRRGEVGAGD